MNTCKQPQRSAVSLAERQRMSREAAYEIESLAAELQLAAHRGANSGTDIDVFTLRGAAIRLEVLAGVVMDCSNDEEDHEAARAQLKGPAATRDRGKP